MFPPVIRDNSGHEGKVPARTGVCYPSEPLN